MTENKRFKMKKLEFESYFIDSQQEYVDEDEPKLKIDGERTMSDSQILDLLNENEQLKDERDYFERKKCEYFNKYNKKHLDNIQLKEENDKLKAICKDHSDHAIDFKADCVRLEKENEELKKELQRLYDVATLNKAIEVLENKYGKMLSDGSDEIKDAMRHTVLRCIEDLDELKDDITAR